MNKKLFPFIVLLLVVAFNPTFAQTRKGRSAKKASMWRGEKSNSSKGKKYDLIGASVNSLNYFGELSPTHSKLSTDLGFTRSGVSVFAERRFRDQFGVRASFLYGRIRGDDFKSADPSDENARFRYVRNQHFRNDIKELSLTGSYAFTSNNKSFLYRNPLTPYVFAGVAIFHHNPKAIAPETDLQGNPLNEGGNWVKLKPLGTEGQYSIQYDVKPYSNFQVAIPFGVGLKYKLNQNWDIAFEFGYRYLFFDYIDDTSADYVNLDALNGSLAKAMSFRGKEETAAYYGSLRNFEAISSATSNYTYEGSDGQVYNVFAGYGSEGLDNIRGNKKDNDVYIVTSVQVIYILPKKESRGKYRR